MAARRGAMTKARAQEKSVLSMLDSITEKALKVVDGCFLPEDHPDHNPDARVPWTEATTKTRLAAQVYQQVMANSREQVRGAVALGVVAMQRGLSKEEWERKAKQVDDVAKQEAIEAMVTGDQLSIVDVETVPAEAKK